MLERKIYNKIVDFYKNNKNRALMITGARQVGKSYIVEKFAKENYKHFVKIDFIQDKEYLDIFKEAKNAEDILLRLTALFGNELITNETLVFFDEVQECKEIITQIKYLLQYGSYDYILSGSLLGTVLNDIASVPVGYMDIIRMYPLDFEEFARANGIVDKVFDSLKKSFDEKTPVDDFINKRFLDLFELYLVVGGMPSCVQTFIDTKNLRKVYDEQKSIVNTYKKVISKYDLEEKLYLEDIYSIIPSELNSKNKRFILKNLNEFTKFNKFSNSFIWLKDAGVALPTYVANEPVSPLILNKSTNLFKLFMSDVGLLSSTFGGDIQIKILNHETNINFGSIYENVAAQELKAHGFELYFYNNKKLGEVDFLIEDNGDVIPIEVKSGKDYIRHRAMDNLIVSYSGIKKGYVFCNANIKTDGNIIYYPIYMLMFLKKAELPNDIYYDANFEDINNII